MRASEFIIERVDDFEYPIPEFKSVYVRYYQGDVYLIGEEIFGAFVDQVGEVTVDLGSFNFVYNLKTDDVTIEEGPSDETKSWLDKDLARNIAGEIAYEFEQKYGTNWKDIYARLHKSRRPGTQISKNYQRLAQYDRFKELADRFKVKAPMIKSMARIKLKRKGATSEQLARLNDIDMLVSKPTNWQWQNIFAGAILPEKEQWANLDNIGADKLNRLLELVVDYIVNRAIETPYRGLLWRS